MTREAGHHGCTSGPARTGAAVIVIGLAAIAGAGSLRTSPVSLTPSPAAHANVLPTIAATLDVNAADARDLEGLPGIGPTLARRIVDDRGANGPFASIEALDRVKGIGPRTIERLRPHLRIGSPGSITR